MKGNYINIKQRKAKWDAVIKKVYKEYMQDEDKLWFINDIIKELNVCKSTFFYTMEKYPKECAVMQNLYNMMRDELEYRLINKGMASRNPAFIIFIMANHFGYSRADRKVEVVENNDKGKEKIVYKFNLTEAKIKNTTPDQNNE